MQSVLVTGGAGYIGSHVARQLTERSERVVVLDNLCTGYRSAVLNAPLVVGDIGDRALVDRVLAEHRVDTVMHFAAHTIVPESVADPLKYYRNNTANSRALIEAAVTAGVPHFIFSSTAASASARARPALKGRFWRYCISAKPPLEAVTW